MLPALRSWRQDRLLRGIVKNSSYLFSSNSISAILSFVQGILATHLLGPDGYGLASGIVIVFATNINRLLSFRMSEVVVRYLNQSLVEGHRDRAAAVVKAAGMLEALTSVAAYLVLLLLSPLAARFFAKDAQTVPLFVFYGLILIGNLVYETSTGVLQSARRFDRLAVVTLTQSIVTSALILAAFIAHLGVWEVLAAYLVGKSLAGLLIAVFAFQEMNTILGSGWQKVSLNLLPDRREMLRFAINTNLNGTVNLIFRDSETLLIGALTSTEQAGYFRLAQGLINLVVLPLDPFIAPTYSEITRTIAQRQWQLTRQVLRRVSMIATGLILSVGLALVLLGPWLLTRLYPASFAPAYPALVILLVGYGFANIFQWNRPLLLALGLPDYPVKVSAAVGVLKTILTFTLVPVFGFLAEAAFLSGYFILSIGAITWRGLSELQKRGAQ